ncbi:MAG TPA: MMPL family transporter, partial [Candidatus Limnocylindria bacterium]|nr:MMPL family transporter [Candidatus Limnocylindria bacterium]
MRRWSSLQGGLLIALAVTTLGLGWQASRLTIESDNRSLTVRRPDEVAREARFAATFGRDDDLLLAVVHPRLLAAEGLEFVDALAAEIRTLPGVAAVYAVTDVRTVVPGAAGATVVPLLPRPWDGQRVAAALDRHLETTGLLVSADRSTAGILIELAPGDDVPGLVVPRLRALMEARRAPGVALHLTGIAAQKYDVNAFIAADQRRLVPLAVATLAAVLLMFFRRLLGVALPLAVMGATVVWTLGLYRMAGLELNAITGLLPPVLMVLSLAPSVHLIAAWSEAPASDGRARMAAARRRVAFPIFFCTLTTACGFASLATSPMPAVRTFGIFTAIGVVVAFALAMTLVPFVLARARPPATVSGGTHEAVERVLAYFATLAVRTPRRVVLAFSAVTAIAAAGLPLVRNNTDLVRFLRPAAPLYRDTMAVDARLTGPNTLDFVVTRRDGRPLTGADDVARMAAFEAAAKRAAEVSGVSSIVPVLARLQGAEEGGAPRLPESDVDAAYLFDLLAANEDPGLLRKLLAPDARAVRFNVRVHAVGTAVAAPLAASLLDEARRAFGPGYEVYPTGAFYRVALDSNELVETQVRSFGLALVLVFAAIGVLFRSLALVVLVAVANVMPIVWTGGLMGFAGIDLSTGTAMIASSVLGVVVDDTIHFLTAFRRAVGSDVAAAVRQAVHDAGPALLVNNVVLILGFWVGAFGSFEPTIMFSVLSGLTMLTAMVCDLLLTPALLVLLGRAAARRRAGVAAAGIAVLAAAASSVRAEVVVVPPALAPALEAAGERRW